MFYFSINFMKKVFPCIINQFVIVTAGLFIFTSCAALKDEEKYYERQEKKQAKLEQKEYDRKVKEHNKLQSKQTLKMMKESKREAKKLNKRRER